jgi:hypothetical protein
LRPAPLALAALTLTTATLAALTPEIIQSVAAVAPHVAGRFRDPKGFQQASSGYRLVFDRRAHIVYGLGDALDEAWPIVHVGPEPGRIIGPTAFSLAPDGTFVVADSPDNRDRIQVFDLAGFRKSGFFLPDRTRPRITFNNVVMSGLGSLFYDGTSILISQPENGALLTEFSVPGAASRTFGQLRSTGHEADRDVHWR